MKNILALLAFCLPLVAAAQTADSEYQISITASGTNCVAPSFSTDPVYQPWDPSFNCYYTSLGDFTDRLDFTSDGTPTTNFEVIGQRNRRYTVISGRAHPTYYFDTAITNVVIVDVSTGNIVAQLTDAPFWAFPQCSTTIRNNCSLQQTDDWFVSVQLPAGNYSLVIMGNVGGNRPGTYDYSLTNPSPPATATDPVACQDE